MGFIDYSRIGAPSYGKELDSLKDTIFASIQHRAQVEAKAQALAEETRHNQAIEEYQRSIAAAQNRRLDQADTREERRFQNEQDDRSLKGVKEAYQALGQDDGSFDAIVAGHGIADSTTNSFTPPVRPTAPTPVGPEPEPAFVGPVQSLEDAMKSARLNVPPSQPNEMTSDALESLRADERARQAAEKVQGQEASIRDYQTKLGGYQAEVGDFNKRQGEFQQAEADYPRQQRNYNEHTVHELQLRNGQKVSMNVADARYAARSKNADDLRSSIAPQLQNELQRARSLGGVMGATAEAEVRRKMALFDEHVAAVMGGAEKPDVAFKAWNADVRDQAHEARIQNEGQLGRESAERRTHEMATRPQATISLGDRKLGYQQEADRSRFLRQDATRWQADNAAKDIGEQGRIATQLVDKLRSREPGTVKNGIMELYRLAQHDNRMSDKDAVIANKIDQSVMSQIQNWISLGAEGLPGDLNIAAAVDTARRLRQYYGEKRTQLEEQWNRDFVATGQYDPVEADVLGAQILPGYKKKYSNKPAPAGRPNKAATGGGGGGGGRASVSGSAVPLNDAGDPDLKALRSILGGP